LLVMPKLFNIIAGMVVLCLLLLRWLPLAVEERRNANQRAIDLATLAAMDFLTGVYNRRHFETLARAELARSQRYMRPLSLLMIDIDHFKAVNDKNIAALCCAQKRESDVVARVGGEEFAVMLPETTATAAEQFAQRLCDGVRKSTPTIYGEALGVTVSVGVAGASVGTSGIETLMRRADQALYDAKRLGRDRVVLSPDHDSEALPQAAQ
jgi:diguanylate cyclase (GGDEF)-like protein